MGGAQFLGVRQMIVEAVVPAACLFGVIPSSESRRGGVLCGPMRFLRAGAITQLHRDLPGCRFCKQRCADGNQWKPRSNRFLSRSANKKLRNGIGANRAQILERELHIAAVACARRNLRCHSTCSRSLRAIRSLRCGQRRGLRDLVRAIRPLRVFSSA
jgi:hypothetical protein